MKTLDACYELNFSKVNFLERKTRIKDKYTLLIGPPKAGKSFLIYDYLSTKIESSYLYIDFENFKNTQINKNDLDIFIKEHKIEILVLENFTFDFELPVCESIIITSALKTQFKNYKSLFLMPLDFEEYLLHEHKHQNTTGAFNQFLKFGNIPQLIHIEEFSKEQSLQNILKLYTKNETEINILKLLFSNIDEKKSIYQLYLVMKKEYKISKDKFYEYCKKYENNLLIFFVEKYEQEKAVKKLYSYNHAFLPAISHNKKFKNEFSNMIFLELFTRYKKIYYLDNIDFYLPQNNSVILSIPFFNPFLIKNLQKKLSLIIKKYSLKEVFIITIGNTEYFTSESLDIQVLPFYEWAVQ